MFRDFPSFLNPSDCLVLNDSRVFPSRLYGRREGGAGGQVEVFLTKPVSDDGLTWTALVWPGKKMRTGERIVVSDELSVDILGRGEFGERTVRLHPSGELFEILDRAGHVPLPPYIRRADAPSDRERYQTVYARERGSVAAPTAGLHFTAAILDACRERGAAIAYRHAARGTRYVPAAANRGDRGGETALGKLSWCLAKPSLQWTPRKEWSPSVPRPCEPSKAPASHGAPAARVTRKSIQEKPIFSSPPAFLSGVPARC